MVAAPDRASPAPLLLGLAYDGHGTPARDHQASDRAPPGHRERLAACLRDAHRKARPDRGRARGPARVRDGTRLDRAVRAARQAATLAGDRPAGVLVLPPARMAEEDRAD